MPTEKMCILYVKMEVTVKENLKIMFRKTFNFYETKLHGSGLPKDFRIEENFRLKVKRPTL